MDTGLFARFGRLLRHPAVLCLASFLVCFCLALLLFLPLDPFARQLEQLAQRQGVQLNIDGPQLRFPLGLGAEEVRISHPQLPHPPFALKAIDLRPLWLSLAGDNPGLDFKLEAFQGQVSGTAYRDGSLQTSLTGLQLTEPLGPQLPLTLLGVLTKGEFNGQLPPAGKNQSRLQLTLEDLRLTGLQKLGSAEDTLPLGQLSCTAEAKGPLIQVSNLTASGPALDLKGNGSLRLGRTAANSSLNLNLVLTPKDALDPVLKDLLSLLKKSQADGSFQLNLRGGLSNLRIN